MNKDFYVVQEYEYEHLMDSQVQYLTDNQVEGIYDHYSACQLPGVKVVITKMTPQEAVTHYVNEFAKSTARKLIKAIDSERVIKLEGDMFYYVEEVIEDLEKDIDSEDIFSEVNV